VGNDKNIHPRLGRFASHERWERVDRHGVQPLQDE